MGSRHRFSAVLDTGQCLCSHLDCTAPPASNPGTLTRTTDSLPPANRMGHYSNVTFPQSEFFIALSLTPDKGSGRSLEAVAGVTKVQRIQLHFLQHQLTGKKKTIWLQKNKNQQVSLTFINVGCGFRLLSNSMQV